MPTVDQLTPAAVATDTDQILVSQNGTARKMTRAQMLQGTQPEIVLPGPRLLGRASAGTGAVEPLALGPGLSLASGTLSLTATGGDIASLPAGVVPTGPEMVPMSQNGGDVAVTYGQFLSGLPSVANVSASNMTVKATGSTATQKMADFAANTLPKSGGQMSGPLVLAADPFLAKQATTKQYTDAADTARVLKAGDTLTGPLTLQADPITALGAATKQYVDNAGALRVLKTGDTMSGHLDVPSIKAFKFGGSLTTPILRAQIAGSAPSTSGVAVIEQQTTHGGGTPGQVFPMQLLALQVGNQYTDGVLIDGPADNRWALGATLHTASVRANGTNGVRSQHGTMYQHVIRLLPEGGYPAGRRGSDLWNCWQVTQDRTNSPSSVGGATVGLEHDISSNNRDDSLLRFHRQVTIGAFTPISQGGLPLEWGYGDYFNSTTGGDNDAFFKVVSAIYAGYTVAGIDFSLGTGERANPYVDSVNRAAAIKMRAGQKIAFDGDGATGKTLGYSASLGLQYVVGGNPVFRIKDSGQVVFSAPPQLPSYTVAGLPTGQPAGAKAFVSNGRKPGQGAGAGTGTEVFFDGTAWIAVTSGVAVTA